MHRQRIDLNELAELTNLTLATWKAARGKRHRQEVAAFLDHGVDRLAILADDILQGQVPYGKYREFTITDPKRRLIHAASFPDRVLHHAIMNLAESQFERTLVPSSYACRPGKGVHCAVRQVQRNLRRYPWYVKVDISGYFPSIAHATLWRLLCRRFKGADFLCLLQRIIEGYQSRPGYGLPIGALTSQHFANLYLDGADRFLLSLPEVAAHVRYMDDTLWWCHDRDHARRVLALLRDYLANERQLRLKAGTQINRSMHGVTYCGFRILPGTIRLTARKRRRFGLLRARWEDAWLRGQITSVELQRGIDAVVAMTLPADSRAWRRQHLQRHPSRVIQAGG